MRCSVDVWGSSFTFGSFQSEAAPAVPTPSPPPLSSADPMYVPKHPFGNHPGGSNGLGAPSSAVVSPKSRAYSMTSDPGSSNIGGGGAGMGGLSGDLFQFNDLSREAKVFDPTRPYEWTSNK